jgi:hypothetical protein
MAVVKIWVCAGGGVSEIEGLLPFLEKRFASGIFTRKTPFYTKPGPKPHASTAIHGSTGKGLIAQIETQLREALKSGDICDVVLVMDDLDCHNANKREQLFLEKTTDIFGDFSYAQNIRVIIGFAAPEIESWLLADWDNTFAKDVDFRRVHGGMRHWLSTTGEVSFSQPESFSSLDFERDTCAKKLSTVVMQSAKENNADYSKGTHTPRLLLKTDADVVSNKCPLFKKWYMQLTEAIDQIHQ